MTKGKKKKDEESDNGKLNMLKRINIYLSIILIIFGLVIVLITLYNKPADMSKVSDFIRLSISFFELLGVTLFTSGIFTVFLQLPDWQKYFEERLRHIVVEQEYLNTLDSESLSNLQVKTLKAYFHNSDIDKEGSFLNYFQENISQYLNQPYRDDVKTEINVLSEEPDGFVISDRIIYNCRMVGGRIQECVKWKPDNDEFIEIRNVSIRVKKNNEDIKEVLTLTNDNGVYKMENGNTISIEEIYKNGVTYNLNDFNEDGLLIEVKSIYKIENGKFCCWNMAHPTNNFYITIHYPENCGIRFHSLLSHPDKIVVNNDPGLYTMQYKEWLLPQSGVVYSFVKLAKSKNTTPNKLS